MMHAAEDGLCYLSSSKVSSAAGELASVALRTDEGTPLGNLDGVLIDPLHRRLRYYVVQRPARFKLRRYLVPADGTARMEPESHTLSVHLDAADLTACREFDPESVRPFSEDDAVSAMFAS